MKEWGLGGKLQLHAPSAVGFLGALPGAATSPILNVEFGAAGGDASFTGTTDLMIVGNFIFSSRPTRQFSRLSFDVNGSGGWSNKTRFAGHDRFGYVNLQIRFNLDKDWDFLARYDCGRKDPDYRKFCGWQSGLALKVGR